MSEILTEPPEEEEGNDQEAAEGTNDPAVTQDDLEDTDELDDEPDE